MKLEDMKVGAFVKCTKPEWECYGDIFEITKELPDEEWEITKIPFWQRRESGKGIKNLHTTFVVKQEVLQHNFKIDKVHQQAHISMLPSKAITINIGFDKITTAESMDKKVKVGLYHEDKYDEFVGAVEALAKLYDRKSPFERLREKSQSHSDLLIEERERINPHVHNNPPKILHPLSLISPSLKFNHSAILKMSCCVFLYGLSYLLLLERQSVERSAVFLRINKQADAQLFLSTVQGRASNHFHRAVVRKSWHNKPSRILLFV